MWPGDASPLVKFIIFEKISDFITTFRLHGLFLWYFPPPDATVALFRSFQDSQLGSRPGLEQDSALALCFRSKQPSSPSGRHDEECRVLLL